VSYDIYFAKRRPDQSWAEVLEELEEAAEQDEADDLPLTPELIAAWDRIVPQAQELLGEIELFETGEARSLDHSSGIQASVYAGEVTITIPYWHRGSEAERLLNLAYALAAVIERETGLEGYDPQTDLPIADSTPAVSTMTTIATELHDIPGGYPGR
jgi:hypothetical protein